MDLYHLQATSTDPWSIGKPERKLCDGLGISQRAAAARTQTVWRWLIKKEIMRNGSESIRVLINHWRWLEANGYKKEASSCKRQAASLTRKNYNVILQYKGGRNENK